MIKMGVFQALDANAILTGQVRQYAEKLLLSDTVPAGSQKLGKTGVSNLGHFLCQSITGHFDTASSFVSGGVTYYADDGINHLRGQLVDGAGQRKLFSDYIPLDLFLSPGRRKVATAGGNTIQNNLTSIIFGGVTLADRADPQDGLFYPEEFEYLFSANSDILFEVKNDSNLALSYELVFHGYRIIPTR